MPVYKDTKQGTWMVKFCYKDWQNQRKWVTKRGFSTKKQAVQWEREQQLSRSGSMEMTFADFVERYKSERQPRIKVSTCATKDNIIATKLLPWFGNRPLSTITTADILRWQNELLSHRNPETGKPYSKAYLKTIHNQLSAIFNHAVRYYHLKENPAAMVGNMGSDRGLTMGYWTKSQYLRFAESMMDYPTAYYCFEVLYWCGLRLGELLALTAEDVDLANKTISITKTFHSIGGKQFVTEPKTPKSNRVITVPDFLAEEIQLYLAEHPEIGNRDRLFPVSTGFLHRMMDKGCAAQDLPRIRIHDLRHSHVSLLIHMGYSALAIAQRMGHESIDITYRYAHLFPSVQTDMARRLNEAWEAENVS